MCGNRAIPEGPSDATHQPVGLSQPATPAAGEGQRLALSAPPDAVPNPASRNQTVRTGPNRYGPNPIWRHLANKSAQDVTNSPVGPPHPPARCLRPDARIAPGVMVVRPNAAFVGKVCPVIMTGIRPGIASRRNKISFSSGPPPKITC